MRIKTKMLGRGLHSSQVVIGLDTRDGQQELVMDARQLDAGYIHVGWPVGRDKEYYLIELPSETFGGSWRVWVKAGDLIEDNNQRKRA